MNNKNIFKNDNKQANSKQQLNQETAKNTPTNTDRASHKYIKWEQTLLTTDDVILFGNEMSAKQKLRE